MPMKLEVSISYRLFLNLKAKLFMLDDTAYTRFTFGGIDNQLPIVRWDNYLLMSKYGLFRRNKC